MDSANADIILNNSTNEFSSLDVTNARDVGITDATSLSVGSINATGAVNINSNGLNSTNIIADSVVLNSGSSSTSIGNITATGGVTVNSNGISLGSITAASVSLDAGSSNITDNNNNNTNITSSGSVSLTATGGIGDGNALELAMDGPDAKLSVSNSSSGSIELSNTGNITLYDIDNATSPSSPFIFQNNNGDVTIRKIALDYNGIDGLADANFTLQNGNIYGHYNNGAADEYIPHIRANSATFDLNAQGEIGSEILNQPLVVDIKYKLTDINTTNTYVKYYLNREPQIYEGANQFKNKALQAIENISGQQLIEVEALANVDEAIFTDVRNYSHSDIALMMPSDQRYDISDEEEEDKEAKQKREKFLNSTP